MSVKMKRIVADKNVLGVNRAISWLAKSSHNQLIVTDYCLIECMQRDPIRNLSADFTPLAPFANQLVFLKMTSAMVGWRPRSSGLQRRWMSNRLTDRFRERLALGGDTFATSMLADSAFPEFATRSQSFLDSISANADEFKDELSKTINSWPSSLLRLFRSKDLFTTHFAAELYSSIRELAATLFRGWPRHAIPPFSDAIHSFEYRFAVACICLALEWSTGNLPKVSGDSLRNDLLDMTYVAYGTMFDGLMTNEFKVKAVYARARFMVDVAKLVVVSEQAKLGEKPYSRKRGILRDIESRYPALYTDKIGTPIQ